MVRVADVQSEELRERKDYRGEGETPCSACLESFHEEVGADAAKEAAEETEYGEDGDVHCLMLGDILWGGGRVPVVP